MDTLVRESNGRATRETERFAIPPASVNETADSYTLELEMPGVSKDGLDISIENNQLSIVGRRSNPAIEGTLVHRESRPHNYRRSFEIDPSIDTGKNNRPHHPGRGHPHPAEGGRSEAAPDQGLVKAHHC